VELRRKLAPRSRAARRSRRGGAARTAFQRQPGPAARRDSTNSINIAQLIPGLLPDHPYGLYAYFDAEPSTVAPAPGGLAVLLIGGAIVRVDRRRRN